MTAPIDIECPACKALAGRYCVLAHGPLDGYDYHHAQRVDAAFRATAQPRDEARALRETLRDAVDRLERLSASRDFVEHVRKEFF